MPEFHAQHPGWSSAKEGQAQNWMNFPAGRTGMNYSVVFSWPSGATGYHLKACLYLDPGDEPYEFLAERRGDIEKAFGSELAWEPLEGRRAARIESRLMDADPALTDRWPEYRRWAIETLGRLRRRCSRTSISLRANAGCAVRIQSREHAPQLPPPTPAFHRRHGPPRRVGDDLAGLASRVRHRPARPPTHAGRRTNRWKSEAPTLSLASGDALISLESDALPRSSATRVSTFMRRRPRTGRVYATAEQARPAARWEPFWEPMAVNVRGLRRTMTDENGI